jgi:surfactin synthase thioesterase subunit
MNPGPWLVSWHPTPDRRPTLLCLPTAGSGCGRYRAWQGMLGDGVSVVGVQLPGRENRWQDPFPSTLAEAAEAVTAEVAELLSPETPLVVFGESLGGLLGYEVIRLLEERGRPPAALVIAACEPPHVWSATEHLRVGDDALRKLLDTGELSADDLDEDSLEYLLEILRKDARLATTATTPADIQVRSAIHAWGGEDDPLVKPSDLDEWSAYAAKEFTRKQFPGGHHFGTDLAATTLPLLAGLLGVGSVPC